MKCNVSSENTVQHSGQEQICLCIHFCSNSGWVRDRPGSLLVVWTSYPPVSFLSHPIPSHLGMGVQGLQPSSDPISDELVRQPSLCVEQVQVFCSNSALTSHANVTPHVCQLVVPGVSILSLSMEASNTPITRAISDQTPSSVAELHNSLTGQHHHPPTEAMSCSWTLAVSITEKLLVVFFPQVFLHETGRGHQDENLSRYHVTKVDWYPSGILGVSQGEIPRQVFGQGICIE